MVVEDRDRLLGRNADSQCQNVGGSSSASSLWTKPRFQGSGARSWLSRLPDKRDEVSDGALALCLRRTRQPPLIEYALVFRASQLLASA